MDSLISIAIIVGCLFLFMKLKKIGKLLIVVVVALMAVRVLQNFGVIG